MESVHEGKKPFPCSHCNANLGSKRALLAHIDVIHQEKQSHSRDICNANFKTMVYLSNHISQV